MFDIGAEEAKGFLDLAWFQQPNLSTSLKWGHT
jgi:hypothetical protein